MSNEQHLSRRAVLGAGLSMSAGIAAAQTSKPADDEPIEQLPLGKTGVKVTRIGAGASFPEYGPRLLEITYRNGVRYFDNAPTYGKTEAALGEWLKNPGRRQDSFFVTKAHLESPDQVYDRVIASLKVMKVDTIDLFFAHGISDPEIPLDRNGKWRQVKDRLVRDKMIRFMGFSTHAEMPKRAACLSNAAKGGWVDALMVACDPGLIRAFPDFDKALETCAKANVGLIAMKSTRGLGKQPAAGQEAFKALGLNPYQAMLVGLWSDGRFACVCSEMSNRKIIEENTQAARQFRKPLDRDQQKILQEGIKQLSRANCPGCDGACRLAAGTPTDFASIARYLCYYDEDGKRQRARELFSQLPADLRQWKGANLQAARQACPAHLDFETILERAARLLG